MPMHASTRDGRFPYGSVTDCRGGSTISRRCIQLFREGTGAYLAAGRVTCRIVEPPRTCLSTHWLIGASIRFSGCPATASTASSKRCERGSSASGSFVARHEEAAAFMACAYAKWTGRLGVCLATTGPGGVHLLNGLYDAKFDRAPVLAITGLPYHDLQQTFTQQDIDHVRLFQDVAELHDARSCGAAHVATGRRRSRAARRWRGAAWRTSRFRSTCRSRTSKRTSRRRATWPAPRVGVRAAEMAPDPRTRLARAAEILNAGKRVAILAGQGALGARRSCEHSPNCSARRSSRRCSARRSCRTIIRYVTGGVGFLGARPSQQVFEECDTLLIVGSTFPYIEYYPKPGQARGVQIDIDATRIGLRFPGRSAASSAMRGARSGAADRACCRSHDRAFPRAGAGVEGRVVPALDGGRRRPGQPMKPQRVARDLSERLAPDAHHRRRLAGTTPGWPHSTARSRREPALRGLGHAGVDGRRAAVRDCGALAYPGRQVVAIRRRRRIVDVAWRSSRPACAIGCP